MRDNKIGLLVKILILIIIILLGIILYIFVIKPQLTNYAVRGYNQGYEYAIIQVAQQVAACQQVPLRVGNQSINIIAVECLQQAQPQ